MKLLMLVAVNICCIYGGLTINKYYVNRLKFFEDLKMFLNYLRKEIIVHNSNLLKLINAYNCLNIDLYNLLINCITETNSDMKSLKLEYLSKEEVLEVKAFLNLIGDNSFLDKIDDQINAFEKYVSESIVEEKNNCKIKGTSSLKLSTVLGLALTIIFL